MEREQPVPAEFRVPDQEQLPFRVEVGIIEGDGFPYPDPADREQSGQGGECRRAQRRAQLPGLRHQRGDVRVGIQVGNGPAPPGGEHAGRRDLGGRVERGQVAGEPAHRRQAHPLPAGGVPPGQDGPCQRVVRSDRDRAAVLGPGDVLAQQLLLAGQPEAQAAAQVKVAVQRLAHAGHDAVPGHGRARDRSASMSAFA